MRVTSDLIHQAPHWSVLVKDVKIWRRQPTFSKVTTLNLSTSLYSSLPTLSLSFSLPFTHKPRSGCVHQAEMPAEGFVIVALICALMAQNCRGELMAHVQDLNPVPESSLLKPKVMIAILARNSAHSLPYYLGCIDRLDYPKERIAIWWESPKLGFCGVLLRTCNGYVWDEMVCFCSKCGRWKLRRSCT